MHRAAMEFLRLKIVPAMDRHRQQASIHLILVVEP